MATYTKNQLKQIYDFAYAYLQKRAQQQGISPHELEKYFNPLNNIFTPNATLDTVYDRFLMSLQNRSYMPNVIKYDNNKDKILSALGLKTPYNFQEIAKNDVERLLTKLKTFQTTQNLKNLGKFGYKVLLTVLNGCQNLITLKNLNPH